MIGAVSSLVDVGHLRNPFIKYRLITIYPVTFYEFLLIKRYLEKEFPKLGSISFNNGGFRRLGGHRRMVDWTEDFVVGFTGPELKLNLSNWKEGYLPLKKNRFSMAKVSSLLDYYNKGGRYMNFISIYYLPQKEGEVADIMLGFLKEFNMVLVNRTTLTDIITATRDNLIKYLRHNVTYARTVIV